MKTTNSDIWQVTGDKTNGATSGAHSCQSSLVTRHPSAFTLIELLVVISIIGVLAAFTVPVLSAVKRQQYISHTRAELGQLQAAIDSYHAAYGFYPPDNPNGVANSSGKLLGNQLYYELEGTTNNGANYTTLDGATSIAVTDVPQAFSNVGGFVNCNKPGSSEDSQPARNFIHELSPRQTGICTNSDVGTTIFVGSVGGPDSTYQPLGVSGLNPWRYKSSGTLTNNPGSYELWIQLVIGGKTNLVCNWSKQVQLNSSLP
jgi:prepilin-type N-terminal cleavage/methylation domain-containing protein